jgi:hypothetical protein
MDALHLIPERELNSLKQEIQAIKNILERKPSEQFKFAWVESRKVPPLLGISLKTWQNWRDKGIIPYSQFGAKIYVNLSDLNAALEANKINTKA